MQAGLMETRNFNLPNVISTCRLAAAPVMLFCIVTRRYEVFTWVLFGALISDILDGVIARVFHLETELGAFLDAMADMGAYLCAVIGIFVFQMGFIRGHWIEMSLILGFYVAEKIKSFLRYGKAFNAFHTYMSKATAYAQGAFVISLFLFGFKCYLFYPAMVLCIAANIEEMVLTSLLKEYEYDVKGLYWVLGRLKART